MGGKNEERTESDFRSWASGDIVPLPGHWDVGNVVSLPEPEHAVVNDPVAPVDTGVQPEPQPTPEPEPAPVLTDIEAAICAYGWECGTALAVARCESGPDYTAGYNGSGHAGTFQISPIHAWRFEARGLDFWTDALTLQWNLEVAYEIWTERYWYAWSCY